MKILFMGTPDIAAQVLSVLADSKHEVLGVFTRPDSVSGRGKKLLPSPVKAVALEHGFLVDEFKSFKDGSAFERIKELNPDAICVVAYGALLPEEVLELPRFGCINVHASLLPRWRGAAPIERCILEGDVETGVSIMQMEAGLDTGPYCVQRAVSIGEKYHEELSHDLAEVGAEALVFALDQIEAGTAKWSVQDDALSNYAAKIDKHELYLDPSDDAETTCRKVRASSDAHPSHAVIEGRNVTVLACEIASVEDAQYFEGLQPGRAVFRAKKLFLMTGNGAVRVTALKPEGKKEMDALSFCAGIQGAKNKIMTWGAM